MRENREGIEQNTCVPLAADYDYGVTGITFVEDSQVNVVNVVVGDMTDLPVQEDEYETDSDNDVEDNTPPDIT